MNIDSELFRWLDQLTSPMVWRNEESTRKKVRECFREAFRIWHRAGDHVILGYDPSEEYGSMITCSDKITQQVLRSIKNLVIKDHIKGFIPEEYWSRIKWSYKNPTRKNCLRYGWVTWKLKAQDKNRKAGK